MSEVLRSKNNKNMTPKIIASVAAALALSACGTSNGGEEKNGSATFAVECPEGSELDVAGILDNYPRVLLECRDGETSFGPHSIELVDDKGILIDDDGEVTHEFVDVDYVYDENIRPVMTAYTYEDEGYITPRYTNITRVETGLPEDIGLNE